MSALVYTNCPRGLYPYVVLEPESHMDMRIQAKDRNFPLNQLEWQTSRSEEQDIHSAVSWADVLNTQPILFNQLPEKEITLKDSSKRTE